MFDLIAHRYNLANDLLSLGAHRLWKRRALQILKLGWNMRFLDLCCGTGDFLSLRPNGIGADLSFEMLREAQKRLSNPLICADGIVLPFKNQSLERVIIGFGIRNIPNVGLAFSEILRILTPGGKLVILEFSKPRGKIFSKIYFFYLNQILPLIGGWISKDEAAYRYLANTIQSFPDGNDFLNLMNKAGFLQLRHQSLSFGIASIYEGIKG